MRYNIFVLGQDALGAAELATLPDAHEYLFHSLMTIEELQGGTIDLVALLRKAERQLDAFEGSIDAIKVLGFSRQHHAAHPVHPVWATGQGPAGHRQM